MNNQQQKIFFQYQMSFEYNEEEKKVITNVTKSSGKTTKFTSSFYEKNEAFLNTFINIDKWVKPKKEREKKEPKLYIDLENLKVAYSDDKKVSISDLKQALLILKRELSRENPKSQKIEKELIDNKNNLRILKNLASEKMPFTKEINELEEKVTNLKKELNKSMEIEED